MRVESAVTRQLDNARVTVLRGEASTLPDIPRPVVPEPPTAEEIAAREAFAADQPQTVFLQFGATVYDQRVSVVSWPHPGNPDVRYEAAVGLDFGLFANVGNFHHKDRPHSLMLLHSHVSAPALEHRGTAMPEVAVETYRVTRGDPADAAGMAPLVALMDLYAAEKDRLLAAHAARQKYLADAEAWRKANPPPPDPAQRTFWLRPHRGSRYLQAEGSAR